MSGPPSAEEPGVHPEFQAQMEAASGFRPLTPIPPPIDPLQAQKAFEHRALWEDLIAHIIAIIMTGGFFVLAFLALLGFVDLSNSAAATFLGTVMGYAVGKIDPILSRYFLGQNPRSAVVDKPTSEVS